MSLRSPRNEFVRKALLALAPAVLLLATASSASAATKFDSIMQDDRLFAQPATQSASLDTADSLGVEQCFLVALDDGDRAIATELADGAFEERRLPGPR